MDNAHWYGGLVLMIGQAITCQGEDDRDVKGGREGGREGGSQTQRQDFTCVSPCPAAAPDLWLAAVSRCSVTVVWGGAVVRVCLCLSELPRSFCRAPGIDFRAS